MRNLIALLACLTACETPITTTEQPDLSGYAPQADLDAALVEIDELRAQEPAVKTGDCVDPNVTVVFDTAIRVLSARMCEIHDEGLSNENVYCTTADSTITTPTNPALFDYATRVLVSCQATYDRYEIIYIPIAAE